MDLKELLGKNVKIIMKDGFVKHGILKEFDSKFLKIYFDSGKTELLSTDSFNVIALENGV